MGSLKMLEWEKKIECGGSSEPPDEESPTASLIKSEIGKSRPPTLACCHVPYILILKQLGWRIRSRWKQYLIRRRRCNAGALRFNYDLRSYSLNFDDGRRAVQDRRSTIDR